MDSTSTIAEEVPLSRLRSARAVRWLFFLLICALLVSALAGVLGTRTGEATARGGGYELSVRHPEVIRPGLAGNVSIELRRPGGFSGFVMLAVTSSYLDIFDENGLDPDPVAAATDGDRLIWTFDPPPGGDTMTVSFDARIEPGVQFEQAKGSVQVLEENRPVVTARFTTVVLP